MRIHVKKKGDSGVLESKGRKAQEMGARYFFKGAEGEELGGIDFSEEVRDGVRFERPYCYRDQSGYLEHMALDEKKMKRLCIWIAVYLGRVPQINSECTSIDLKGVAEKMLGFYISNADIKKAMIESGYKTYKTDVIKNRYWNFNVSKKQFARIKSLAKSY